jgi:hypothetical protein
MSDEQYQALTDTVMAEAVSFVKSNFRSEILALDERLEDQDILNLARTALHDSIAMQAQMAFSNLYANDREMRGEAKKTLIALRKVTKLLDEIPERSAHRFLRSSKFQLGIFSDHFRSSLDYAIERFEHWSKGQRGRPSQLGYILSAEYATKALEVFLGRKFKRDLLMADGIKKSSEDRSDQNLVSLDARFVETMLKLIDPSITPKNVKSALQGFFKMENALKNRAQNAHD